MQRPLRRRAWRDRAPQVRAPRHRDADARRAQGAGGARRRDAELVAAGGGDPSRERGGAHQQGEARGAQRLDHHRHESREARGDRQHADHQCPGSGDHRRQPRRRAPGGGGGRRRHTPHHERLLVLRSSLRRRLRRRRDDPGAQGMPRASRHDFHRRVSRRHVSHGRVSHRHVSGRCAFAALALGSLALASGCGGGGGGSAPPPVPPFTSVTQVRVSQSATFTAGCDGVAATGTLYTGTAVEPSFALNPLTPSNLIAAWQQNRWSDGGSQGLDLAASFDGGMTWTLTNAAFSRCTGGNAGNGGDYARASDVWLTFSSGAAYALSLSFTGGILQPGSSSAMLVARSGDGGMTWSVPTTLIKDGATAFNDKGSITADPNNASYVYAVWDRLTGATGGPSYFAVTADGGSTWQAPRSIYDPGPQNQTLGNQIVVLPGTDVLVNIFTEIDNTGGAGTSQLRAVRSLDHGTTWSAPVTISSLTSVGVNDPQSGTRVRDGSGIPAMSLGPGGVIYVAWQDSRFSSGQRDGIAMAQSSDGGLTWSAPVEVNADHNVQAFTPTIHVRADGVIGVTYYDLRNDTASSALFLADCWLVTSSDGVNFKETHLSGPFDLNQAAHAEGLFLGDYQALTATATAFVPFYARTGPSASLFSDVFISFPPASAAGAAAGAGAVARFEARPAPADATLTPDARRRAREHLALVLAHRGGEE